jgi:coenzyme PQQ precursor peptide PqqA
VTPAIQVVAVGIKDQAGNLTVQRGPLTSGGDAKLRTEERLMSWKTPKIVEIALGAEINCYACAELK